MVKVFAIALLSASIATSAMMDAVLADGARVVLVRGEVPRLLVLPETGEGWLQLARRVCGDPGAARQLAEANPSVRSPLRDVRVNVPWELARPDLRAAAVQAIFPNDRRTAEGWSHIVTAAFDGEPESWWEIAALLAGDGSRYRELREANPDVPLFPPAGTRIVVPERLLVAELRGLSRQVGDSQVEAPEVSASAPQVPTPAPTRVDERAGPLATAVPGGVLEYVDSAAVYRLRPGEALYSAVVVRFTGQLHAVDVNATAAELARLSGIADVTDIPIGYPVKIPFDLLLPEYLPSGHPRRVEWEREREELAVIRRDIRAANLDGIHVILDAGHGGADTGAIVGGVWESTYVYDVMTRLKNVLERDTRATVWTLVRDTGLGTRPPALDRLPAHRGQQLLVDPPYDLSESSVGVHLRWILNNAILKRLRRQGVSPERVVFVSIHADSLHPAVRGLMVYAPARNLRPSRSPTPQGLYACREVQELGTSRYSSRFRARAEALSTQLGEAIVRKAGQFNVPIHPFEPVRSSVLRGRSRWVPAVLRYSDVPTSVLVEICNLNNVDDRSLLTTWKFREKLAHAIAAGLAEGFAR